MQGGGSFFIRQQYVVFLIVILVSAEPCFYRVPFFYTASSISTEVPLPGCELTSSFPFKNSTRLLILLQPIPLACVRMPVSKPLPSSSTVMVSWLSVLLTCTMADFAAACLMVLLTSSCTIR